MHKSLHLLLYCLNTIYWEWKKGNSEKNLEQLDAQHSAPAHWTVCMYFIACYFELLLWTIYMNCNIDICVTCVTVNELWWI